MQYSVTSSSINKPIKFKASCSTIMIDLFYDREIDEIVIESSVCGLISANLTSVEKRRAITE